MSPSRANTTLLAILACLLWSTAFVGIKIGLEHTPPLNFAGIRFMISGLMLLPLAGNPGATLRTMWRHRGFVIKVAVLSTGLLYAFFYLGLSLGSASTTAIVVGGGPLFVALMAHLMMPDERFTLRKGGALLIGIGGIAVIAASRYSFDWNRGQEFWAVILLVAANISGGFGNIFVARSRASIPPLLLSAAQLFIGGGLLFGLSLIVERPDLTTVKPLPYYLSLLYLSTVSAAAMTIWFVLLKRPGIKVSELNIWKFLIPVFGAVLSWTLLDDDHPDTTAVIGMCCITLSLLLINLPRRRLGRVRSDGRSKG